ncbi:ribosomal protein S18 acetylase RimI-like enzyme [Palleronia aestuarii]|uniref:Ribosomal protein S18 acetylase RimI-like enzyme n=1 Tax=Palleronia aestuarii TaxID=568105 RepID=A0A2W7NH41_9RHOB|nr:GNAT family N-acetyltransferase [Palleronia aestuarii]PZX17517.1 ribosomal protein S18 acetylase RimI-like enzyme [Palleronia aestuarii]
MMRIEAATSSDLSDIKRLHTESWRTAYAPFLPSAALDRLDAEMERRWTVLPADVEVARSDGEVLGFVRTKKRDGWAYIDNLHVHPDMRGRGIGQALFHAAGQRLAATGEGGVWLTVIAANTAARRFYRAMGGFEGGLLTEPVLGCPTRTRPVIWRSLRRFASANDRANALDAG